MGSKGYDFILISRGQLHRIDLCRNGIGIIQYHILPSFGSKFPTQLIKTCLQQGAIRHLRLLVDACYDGFLVARAGEGEVVQIDLLRECAQTYVRILEIDAYRLVVFHHDEVYGLRGQLGRNRGLAGRIGYRFVHIVGELHFGMIAGCFVVHFRVVIVSVACKPVVVFVLLQHATVGRQRIGTGGQVVDSLLDHNDRPRSTPCGRIPRHKALRIVAFTLGGHKQRLDILVFCRHPVCTGGVGRIDFVLEVLRAPLCVFGIVGHGPALRGIKRSVVTGRKRTFEVRTFLETGIDNVRGEILLLGHCRERRHTSGGKQACQ